MNTTCKNSNWQVIIGSILFVTLLISIVYAVYNLITAPAEHAVLPHGKIKSDYVLMLLQCSLAMIMMFIPSFLQRRLAICIPNYMFMLFFVFLFCSVVLGEVRDFYYLVPHWDTILHAFSGVTLGALGFSLVSILNDDHKMPIHISPFFIAFFSFCFAVAAGTVWEIYEFIADGVLALNMQKFAIESGTALTGRAALMDTMKDLIVDTLGALVVTIVGYLVIKRQKNDTSIYKA